LNILIVKLSSLGDVVHTMPAVQDIRRALPQARIDWVVEPGFAPLVARCEGVRRVIPCAIRTWRKHWWRDSTRAAWQAFQADLAAVPYDAVIDCQGLTKSAIVARCTQLTQTGKRYAMANRSAGSGYEAPTRWLADVALQVPTRVHAVDRARILCAQALGYAQPTDMWHFGLLAQSNIAGAALKTIAFIHGSSRADKCWSEPKWVQLGKQLQVQGYAIALLHGSDEEEQRSLRIAQALGGTAVSPSSAAQVQSGAVQVWPRLPLDALTDRLALCAGAIGVDSGLSHVAVALDLPHVQLYNFDTAWRTGPLHLARQCSVFAQPEPAVQQVWEAWCQVLTRRRTSAPARVPSANPAHA
jgi:heptosyltransferase I